MQPPHQCPESIQGPLLHVTPPETPQGTCDLLELLLFDYGIINAFLHMLHALIDNLFSHA